MFLLALYLAGVIAHVLLYQSWLREKRARASLLTGLDTGESGEKEALKRSSSGTNRRLLRYQNSSVFDVVAEQWRGTPAADTFEAFV